MVRFTRQRLRFGQPRASHLLHQKVSIERCPSCGRAFTSGVAVLKHLNNPRSNCSHAWFPPLQENDVPLQSNDLEPSPSDHTLPDWISGGALESDIDTNFQTSGDYSSNRFCEMFPGASAVFGQGKTFLDRFDEDEHAPKRQTNLYYPFASEAEWELASFLHRSGLSTRAIDSFFSLQVVSFPFLFQYISDSLSSLFSLCWLRHNY